MFLSKLRTYLNRYKNADRYDNIKIVGMFVCILGRVLRSAIFNVMMIILGFCVGYSYMSCKIYYHATSCDNNTYITEIQKHISEIIKLDKEYTTKEEELIDLLNRFSIKLSYDENNMNNNK